jgi:hypothetical protein
VQRISFRKKEPKDYSLCEAGNFDADTETLVLELEESFFKIGDWNIRRPTLAKVGNSLSGCWWRGGERDLNFSNGFEAERAREEEFDQLTILKGVSPDAEARQQSSQHGSLYIFVIAQQTRQLWLLHHYPHYARGRGEIVHIQRWLFAPDSLADACEQQPSPLPQCRW